MKKARMMLLIAALAVGAYAQSRPHNPFVEKVVTPLRSRQLKVALNNELWIMYDMPHAELYMAWAGGTGGGTLKNAVYWYGNQVHFPHWFYPDGTKYFETQVGEMFSPWTPAKDIDTYYGKWPKQPRDFKNWSVTSGGAEVFDYVANHGYFTQGNIFKFHNGLKLKGGAEIDVMEIPEGEGKKLTRKITFTGTNGATVKLKLPGGPGWAVTGKGRLEGGSLVQDGDGESTITVQF